MPSCVENIKEYLEEPYKKLESIKVIIDDLSEKISTGIKEGKNITDPDIESLIYQFVDNNNNLKTILKIFNETVIRFNEIKDPIDKLYGYYFVGMFLFSTDKFKEAYEHLTNIDQFIHTNLKDYDKEKFCCCYKQAHYKMAHMLLDDAIYEILFSEAPLNEDNRRKKILEHALRAQDEMQEELPDLMARYVFQDQATIGKNKDFINFPFSADNEDYQQCFFLLSMLSEKHQMLKRKEATIKCQEATIKELQKKLVPPQSTTALHFSFSSAGNLLTRCASAINPMLLVEYVPTIRRAVRLG